MATPSLNKTMLIGNLGRDPQLSYTTQQVAVCGFSIATNERWTDRNTGEQQSKTEWHRIVVFGKQAEICSKYLAKGSSIYIEGRLQTRPYEKEGQTHFITEIIASHFQFLSPGRSEDQNNGGQQGGYQGSRNSSPNDSQEKTNPGMTGGPDAIPDDDIPSENHLRRQ